MTTRKLTARQKKNIEEKSALKKRLHDLASGAGFDDIDQEGYWCFGMDSLVRLIRAVDEAFDSQTEKLSNPEGILTNYWNLRNYECLDALTAWMFDCGYRA